MALGRTQIGFNTYYSPLFDSVHWGTRKLCPCADWCNATSMCHVMQWACATSLVESRIKAKPYRLPGEYDVCKHVARSIRHKVDATCVHESLDHRRTSLWSISQVRVQGNLWTNCVACLAWQKKKYFFFYHAMSALGTLLDFFFSRYHGFLYEHAE